MRGEPRGHRLGSKLTRRGLLRGLAVGAAAPALSALLAACARGQATPTPAPQPTPTAAPAAQPTPTVAAASPTPAAPPTPTPVVLKGTKLNILFGTLFVPETQDLMKQQLQEFGKETGVEATIDFINWPDLQPKISAAVQAGAGPDIVGMFDTWPSLYKDALVDVADIVEKRIKGEGDYFDWVKKTVMVGDQWLSIPIGAPTSAQVYRKSLLEKAGWPDPNNPPDTWEDLFKIGVEFKKLGMPLGQAFGHSTGDPPSFCYAFMWAYGAMEVEADGKTVAFNKPQFVEGMKLLLSYWKQAFDETGLSWDDATNNRAFLAGQIGWTFNGSSIYIAAKKQAPDIAEDIIHQIFPKGPAGRFNNLGSWSIGILKYSKNVAGAKAFLEWWTTPEQFRKWLEIQQGYQVAPTQYYLDDPYYKADPKLVPYVEAAKYGRNKGYAGLGNEKAAEAFARYVVVDTFARAIQSGNAEEAIQWGASELEKIYSR
jgi:multiple sugar transport system substrate-binding protein